MKKIIKNAKLALFLLFFLSLPVSASAATLSLQPSSGTMITDCPFTVDVIIDTQGQQTDASQVYLKHNLSGFSENLSFLGNGIYSSYSNAQNLPQRIDTGLLGYGGGNFSGNNLKFGEIRMKSDQAGKTVNVDIDFNKNKSITSKVADQGANILSSVNNGSYQVVNGYCETVPPNVQNLDPAHKEPNHPVDQNVKFDLTDNSSGVDISTLQVEITHNNQTKTYGSNDPQLTYTQLNNTDYSVEIDPNNNFKPQMRVDVKVEVADNAGNVGTRTYYFNDLTCQQLGCPGSKVTTQCNDGQDNDGDGLIDSNDPHCTSPNDNNEYQPGQTQCNDGQDNDGDGLIDFNDPECQSESGPTQPSQQTTTTTVTTTVPATATTTTKTITKVVTTTVTKTPQTEQPQCNDGIDNDGDNLVDYPDDPGCDNKQDDDEFDQATQGVLSLSELDYYIEGIKIRPSQGRVIEALRGVDLEIRLDVSGINKQVDSATINLQNSSASMYYDNQLNKYTGTMAITQDPGTYGAYVRVDYNDGSFDSIPFSLLVQPSGKVTGRDSEGQMNGVADANIELRKLEGNNYVNVREITSNEDGFYGVFVENGAYKLRVTKDGYENYTTAGFRVEDNTINREVQLLRSVSLTDPNVPVEQKMQYVRDLGVKRVKEAGELADDPQIEEQAQNSIAPAAAAVTGAVVAPALGLLNLLNYLRFLFFQPLLLMSRRKREDWGVVYNSLDRKKIDLAVVRLVDYDTNEVVQSRVTDAEGRYIFFAKPGRYRIKVEKEGFNFPTAILSDAEEDGPYTDVYHGEPIKIEEENTAVAPNIPLDPEEAEVQTPSRLKWDRIKKTIQRNLARIGIIAGVISMLINPTILVGVLLAAQIGFYYLFKRLGTTPEPENWGIIREKGTKRSVNNATVRLFTKDRNKLVSTQRTDDSGRYAFLVGPKDYYVRIDKEGYNSESKEVSITEEEEFVKEDIEVNKSEDSSEEQDEGEDDLSFAE